MSRSNYSDDVDGWSLIRWRGQVASAIRGVRGQRLLMDMAAAMDEMQRKVLIADALEKDGDYCALGVVGHARGIDVAAMDPENMVALADALDIAPQLAQEIAFLNDEYYTMSTPWDRWKRMRLWVRAHISHENLT